MGPVDAGFYCGYAIEHDPGSMAVKNELSLRFFVCMVVFVSLNSANAEPVTRPLPGQVIRLWEGDAPRATGNSPADIPTVTVFLPAARFANGCAVVICPGGGYGTLVTRREGTEVAAWLNEHGIGAFVLAYRHKPYGQPIPMLDGQRAIRLVRYHARAWGIDWKRIGIMGFSAGGHVASTVGTHWDKYIPASPDPINGQSCRPDFMLLAYPVISMKTGITHPDSRKNLLGDHPPQKLVDFYSNELQVRDDTPPTFIVAAKPDTIVSVKNSELFYAALRAHKIPAEFLELPVGRHGFGLATSQPSIGIWTTRCLVWMKSQGLLGK
jgi:acetyl esterase/lipase